MTKFTIAEQLEAIKGLGKACPEKATVMTIV